MNAWRRLLACAFAATLAASALAAPFDETEIAKPPPKPASAADERPAQPLVITRSGTQPSTRGPAQNFSGDVRVDWLFRPKDPARASGAYVTFEPGARTAWHTHPLGQILVVTAGVGRVQQWGGPVEEIRTGDVVWIPPHTKHWHGAAPEVAVTQLGIQEHIGGKTVDWLEKVSDAQYKAAPAAR